MWKSVKQRSVLLGVCLMLALTSAALVSGAFAEEKHMNKTEVATFGGGCFWCMEAIFERVKGIDTVESGYSGGTKEDATYAKVSKRTTAHAESIQITFDPAQISFSEILEIFFHLHNPTTLNRQGADVGPEYRSVIFYHDDTQKNAADAVIKKITEEKLWADPIVTELSPFTAFYLAEAEHQNFYQRNPKQPYCDYVIAPKIQKLYKQFAGKLKPQ